MYVVFSLMPDERPWANQVSVAVSLVNAIHVMAVEHCAVTINSLCLFNPHA